MHIDVIMNKPGTITMPCIASAYLVLMIPALISFWIFVAILRELAVYIGSA